MNNGQLVPYGSTALTTSINYDLYKKKFTKPERDESEIIAERKNVEANKYLSAAFLKKHLLNDKSLCKDLGIKNNHANAEKHFTYCYLCSINGHVHEKSAPVPVEKRRYLTPYKNPVEIRKSDQVKNYKLEYSFKVKTGENKYAGTDSEVWFSLYGTKGHWPKTELKKQKTFNGQIRYPPNSESCFKLNGPEIGELTKLKIWHNSQSPKDGLYLDFVEITCTELEKTWKFNYNQWISKYRPPNFSNETVISLDEENNLANKKAKSSYFVFVKTIERRDDTQDIEVLLQLKCSNGLTPMLKLFSKDVNVFRSNQLDIFYIDFEHNLGSPERIRVTHDSKKIARDWLIEDIRILYSHEPNIYFVFPFEKWLEKVNEFSSVFRPMSAIRIEDSHKMIYFVTVVTGNVRNGGTDANVFVEIEGSLGKTSPHRLNNGKKNMFERGAQDNFNFIDFDIGQIQRIRIWHDNSGSLAGWYLQTVLLKSSRTSVTGDKSKEDSILKENLDRLRFKLENENVVQKKRTFKSIATKRPKSADPKSRRNLSKDIKKRASSAIIASKETTDKRIKSYENLKYTDLLNQKLQPILKRAGSPRNMTRNVSFDNKSSKSKPISRSSSTDMLSDVIKDSKWVMSIRFNEKNQIKAFKTLEEYDEKLKSMKYKKETGKVIESSIKDQQEINDQEGLVYIFECKNWLAKDEGDGKIERVLKPTDIIKNK